MATRVAVAQEGLSEAMTQVLAASNTTGASVASDADMVDKEHTGGENPVSSIVSPMFPAFCYLILVMRSASGVCEVKYENFVERCVKYPEEKRMYKVLRNAGRVFLHENLWNRWSRGLSFVEEMPERHGVRETNSELCRS